MKIRQKLSDVKILSLIDQKLLTSHPIEDCLTFARSIESALTTLTPDMFWNNSDPEIQYKSIDELLNDELCNGRLEEGDILTIQQGFRFPNVKIKVTAIDNESSEVEWEQHE